MKLMHAGQYSVWENVSSQQYRSWNDTPSTPKQSPQTPREVSVSLDDIEEISSKRRRMGFWIKASAALLAFCALVGAAVGTAAALAGPHSSTGVITTTMIIETISTATTTTTVTFTTTTINCISPYALTSNNTCVNILIDFNNCGVVGHVCGVNDTSCSAGVCSGAPAVQLSSANFIWTAAVNGSVDDNYFGLSLPFNLTLYTTTTNYAYVSTSGVLCLGGCSTSYTETALPTSSFNGATAFPYWDDLYIYSGTSQGIYYATQGNAPNRTLIFEYYMSHYNAPNEYYHYQVLFFEALPGVVKYIYYDSSDTGISCTIGVQASLLLIDRKNPCRAYGNASVYDITNLVKTWPVTLKGTGFDGNEYNYWWSCAGNTRECEDTDVAICQQRTDGIQIRFDAGNVSPQLWFGLFNGPAFHDNLTWDIVYPNHQLDPSLIDGTGIRVTIVHFIVDSTVDKPILTMDGEKKYTEYSITVRGKCIGQPAVNHTSFIQGYCDPQTGQVVPGPNRHEIQKLFSKF